MGGRVTELADALALLARLDMELQGRQAELELLNDYYIGRHPLAFASEKFQNAFGGLFVEFADNWCDLVVDATEERLNVDGFRFGEAGAAADDQAWRFWQENNLDADSQVGHAEALIGRRAFVLVWDDGDDEGRPEVTVEHASECIVAYEPGSRRKRRAALKRWREDGRDLATLYLPDSVWKFERRRSQLPPSFVVVGSTGSAWIARDTDDTGDDVWPIPNPLGVVPMLELRNRPRLKADPESELSRVIPIQDGINKLVADLLVASEFGAFRQRWATGLEIPVDETGAQIEPFRAAVDRLWISEDNQTRFGEFGQVDLSGFTGAIELLVQHVASQTRTPPHYFALSGQFPSGDAIKSAETGLVAKVRRRMTSFGETWEEAMRLAFAVAGDDAKAATMTAETLWRDPESRSEGELVDAAVKLSTIGVPQVALWERIGATPQQIKRWRELQDEEAAAAADSLDDLLVGGGTVEPVPDADAIAKRVAAATALIRAGFDQAAALEAVGLDPIEHTGAVSVALRLPADDATALEQ
jgi:hypothetical protein